MILDFNGTLLVTDTVGMLFFNAGDEGGHIVTLELPASTLIAHFVHLAIVLECYRLV